MVPIATRINTKLTAHKLLSSSPLPVFYHILFHVFVFLLPITCIQQTNSYLKASAFAVFSTWTALPPYICVHCCGCYITPLRSLFRNEGLSPLVLTVYQQTALNRQSPLRAASCFLIGAAHVQRLIIAEASMPAPLPPTPKGYISNRVPCGAGSGSWRPSLALHLPQPLPLPNATSFLSVPWEQTPSALPNQHCAC